MLTSSTEIEPTVSTNFDHTSILIKGEQDDLNSNREKKGRFLW